MDNLAFSLRTLCQHNADGSEATRANRQHGLMAISRELKALGYKLPDARSLKPKHITALVAHWKGERLSDATIKNRLAWMRWWAMKTAKPGLVPKDNTALGVADTAVFKGKRAAVTPADRLAALPERMQLAIRLQMAFGLRLEESLKFKPETADKGAYVALTASWCKGGRARSVPLTHQRQRDLLDEVHRICGDGALIPPGMSYIGFRKAFERATLEAGITNVHKHRHWYACWRYQVLTGQKAPAEGGPTYERLSVASRTALDAARLTVSRELGHNRLDVTDAYLGRRWDGGKAGA